MTTYQYALGYDNTGDLQDWPLLDDLPPRVGGLRAGRRTIVGNGSTIQDGKQSCVIDYGFINTADLTTLLAAFELDPENGSASRAVTVKLPRNKDRAFTNYNAIIVAPDFPQNGEFIRGKWGPTQFVLQRIDPI